jgi:putative DNA primase/helicase
MRIDAAAVRAALSVSDVVGRYVHLKKAGREWKGLCPFHEEKSPSFTVNDEKQLFCCFGCGAKGDVIDFIARREGLEFKQALDEAAKMAGLGDGPAAARPPPPKPAKTTAKKKIPIVPVPADAPAPSFRHPKHGQPSRTWTYRDAEGRVLGYVCRFDPPEGGKEVMPRCYTAEGWSWVSFGKPRPLYGLELLAQRPTANVVIVEGEKAADAGRVLLPAAVVVSWPGGGKAVRHVDWTPLRGRKVVIWGDHDLFPYREPHPRAGQTMPPLEQPGAVTALEIAQILGELGCQVRVVKTW